MKYKFFFLAASLLLAVVLCSSCHEMVNQVLNTYDYHAYLLNQTDYDVTVSYHVYDKDYSFEVKSGDKTRVYEDRLAELFDHPGDIQKVTFVFSDSTKVTHTCSQNDDKSKITYKPSKTSNILSGSEEEGGSWELVRVGGKTYNYNFNIKR